MYAIVLVGPPASGKTTYAHTHYNAVVATRDDYRYKLFQQWGPLTEEQERIVDYHIDTVVKSAFYTGKTFVADNTNLTIEHRKMWLDQLRSLGYQWVEAHVINTPLDICLERNKLRKVEVPVDFLIKAHKRFHDNWPTLNEGFDCIRVISDFYV